MGTYTGMNVEILLATRPTKTAEKYGLLTIKVHVPNYIWMELLTHRIFARNATSNRAMSTDRSAGLGYYIPIAFYKDTKGMQASSVLCEHQTLLHVLWRLNWIINVGFAKIYERLNVAKEQRNRLLPKYQYQTGIVTGTEYAWANFLRLRNHPAADTAMQEFARMVQGAIERAEWKYSTQHIPLYPHDLKPEPMLTHNYYELKQIAAARIARVSYARTKGKNDLELANTLLKEGHLSPCEHIAEWKANPKMCAFNVIPNDRLRIESQIRPDQHYSEYGWQSWRTELE